jgi:hypothetical protein
MALFQLLGVVACVFAAIVNFDQARKLNAKRKDLDKRLRPVCQVISRDNGACQLGVFGPTLPDVGTTLYMLDLPQPKREALHV